MSENYNNIEEILENPGIFIFKLENQNVEFPKKKKTNKYDHKDVNIIKSNIIKVFQNISENIENFKTQNPEYLGHIVKNLNSRYSNKGKFIFPGLQVINMDREKLNFFTHYPERFLICEKSDGVRYLLIQYNNGICHLVARNLEFFEIYIPERLPSVKLQGDWSIEYLLDGELVLDDADEKYDDKSKFIKFNGRNKKINYLIFDAVVIKGYNIGYLPFWRRLEDFSRIFMNEYDMNKYIKNCANSFVKKLREELKIIKSSNNNKNIDFPNPGKIEKSIKLFVPGTQVTNNTNNKIITLYMKDYYHFTKVKQLNDFIKLLPHHNDGLIINVDDYPYYSGQSCEIFKWKPIEMNTIDFEIKYNKEKDRYLLFVVGNEDEDVNKTNLLPVEILSFESDEEKNNFSKIYNKYENKLIAECFYDPNINGKEVAINNYYLEKIKSIINDIIPFKLDNFPKEITSEVDKEKLKGGWRFQRTRTDKSSANFIKTYQNIKVCIKENLHIEEIFSTVDKNLKIVTDHQNEERKIYSQDLANEKNFMSALVWKKFFKKSKNDDIDEFVEEELLDINKSEDKNQDKDKLLNKKRMKPDVNEEKKEEKEIGEEFDDKDKNNSNDEDDIDKLYDDDYGDDFY